MPLAYSFDLAAFDFATIHGWLANTYWSPGISFERVEKGFRNSTLCVGAFCDGKQVGMARAVSDTTRFGYIADVYVDEKFRNRGIAREMVRQLMNHADLRDTGQWCLLTKDAHAVYEPLGYEVIRDPRRFMICYDKSKALNAP